MRAARPHLAAAAEVFVVPVHVREASLELKRDSLAHDADAIDRVDPG